MKLLYTIYHLSFKKWLILLYFLPFVCFAQSPLNPNLSVLVQGHTRFAFDLYHQLKTSKGNLCFSPYGISLAFEMAATGARGATLNEMQRVLYYQTAYSPLVRALNEQLLSSSTVRGAPQLLVANAAWIQKGFPLLPQFERVLKNDFNAQVGPLDFIKQPVEAVNRINQWVSGKTNQRINQLITTQDINAQTRLVLTNAIYMKGQWARPFNTRSTRRASFFTFDREIQVQMMQGTFTYPLYTEEKFAIIEMPYLSGGDVQLSMLIILPSKNSDFLNVERAITLDNWQQWRANMKEQSVALSLPRFQIENKFDLNQTMSELGMITAFNQDANFSGITSEEKLSISKALHKTFMRVDESGTEAAAATGVAIGLTSVRQPESPYVFNADHPFLFAIIETRTQSLIFMGRVVEP